MMLQDIPQTYIVMQHTGVMNGLKSLHNLPSFIIAQVLKFGYGANQLQYDHKVNGSVSTAKESREVATL